VWIREMSANDPLMKHRKPQRRHPKPGLASRPGTSMKGTYLLVMWVSGVQEAWLLSGLSYGTWEPGRWW